IFTYVPDSNLLTRQASTQKPVLLAESGLLGVTRYSGVDDIQFTALDENNQPLAVWQQSVKVTNDLPIMRSTFSAATSLGQGPDRTPLFELGSDTTLTVYADPNNEGSLSQIRTYQIDINDLFYDPDGDPISVNDLSIHDGDHLLQDDDSSIRL